MKNNMIKNNSFAENNNTVNEMLDKKTDNKQNLTAEEVSDLTRVMRAGRTIDEKTGRYDYTKEAKDARDKIVLSNQGLIAQCISATIKDRGKLDYMDLVGFGNEGLIKAVDRFDPDKGFSFSTYAVYWIKQKLLRGVYNERATIRRPEHFYEALNRIKRKQAEILAENENLTADELIQMTADELNMSREKVEQIIANCMDVDSLDRSYGSEDEDYTLGDTISNDMCEQPEDCLDSMMNDEIRARFEKSNLTDREKLVLVMRFGLYDGETYTLEETGKVIGVVRERVRQIEEKALKKLRCNADMEALYNEMYKLPLSV